MADGMPRAQGVECDEVDVKLASAELLSDWMEAGSAALREAPGGSLWLCCSQGSFVAVLASS
jgi:hypothetical protein